MAQLVWIELAWAEVASTLRQAQRLPRVEGLVRPQALGRAVQEN
ncbi:hypothetical protein ACXIUT_19565 [Achromobacter denitrificans]|jgi:hypothetical protein